MPVHRTVSLVAFAGFAVFSPAWAVPAASSAPRAAATAAPVILFLIMTSPWLVPPHFWASGDGPPKAPIVTSAGAPRITGCAASQSIGLQFRVCVPLLPRQHASVTSLRSRIKNALDEVRILVLGT